MTAYNEVQQILANAKALIDTPEKWCKGENALDAEGKKIAPQAIGSCRWCMEGAVIVVGLKFPYFVMRNVHSFLAEVTEEDSYFLWNDAPERTHAEVMAAFDKAIELAGAGS